MIRDQGNIFVDGVDVNSLTQYSDVVDNRGGGIAINALWLNAVVIDGDDSGSLEMELQSSDDPSFSLIRSHGIYTVLPGNTGVMNVKLPTGLMKWLRLEITNGFSTGELTASLVTDVDTVTHLQDPSTQW